MNRTRQRERQRRGVFETIKHNKKTLPPLFSFVVSVIKAIIIHANELNLWFLWIIYSLPLIVIGIYAIRDLCVKEFTKLIFTLIWLILAIVVGTIIFIQPW